MKSRLEKVYGKLPNQKVSLNSRKHKVALGLVDSINYEYTSLEDEVSRLSYSVDEWFDEKYDALQDAYMVLKEVYINNSESFIAESDVAGDLDILNEIKAKAEELGISVDDVYPNWNDHVNTINRLEDLEKRFDDQKRRIEEF